MRLRALSYLALAMFGLLAVVAARQPQTPAGDLQTFAHQLDQRVPGLLGLYNVPGAAVALVHDGELAWSQGYGMADAANHLAVTPGTVFKCASISKAVTAWGVMRLVEQGRLELDAPAERYLTRWHLPASQYDANGVTIRRLLSHTAGISEHIPLSVPLGQAMPSLEQALSGGGDTSPVSIAMQPGMQYSYTGAGYAILQLIIEEVTGETFAAYMQHAVLEPLGMLHSSFEWRTDLRPATAVGYGQQGNAYPNDLSAEAAAAGLYATAPDLARFVAAGMPGPHGEPAGRGVLSPQAIDLMFTPVAEMRGVDALTNSTVGLGHFIEVLPDGTPAVAHAGTNWGWQAVFVSLPERGEGIVVLTNGTRGLALYAELLREWTNWLGIGSFRVSRSFQGLQAALLGLAIVLSGGFIYFATALVKAARAGRRQWLWRFSGRPNAAAYLGFAASMLISLLVAGVWYIAAHQFLDWLIGRLAYALTTPVLAWCLFGVLGSLLRTARAQSSSAS